MRCGMSTQCDDHCNHTIRSSSTRIVHIILISSFVHPLSKVWFIRTIVSVYKSFRQSSTTSSFASSDIMDDQIEELRQQFHVFDANGSGFIEKYELKEALKTLGFQISEKGFDNLLHIVGSTDDRLNFDEFIVWNRELYKEEMKNEFDTIDADNSGWISKSELREYSKKMKYDLTEEQIEDFLYQADANQNDKVGLDEYISAMAASLTGKAYFIINAEMYLEKLKADFKAMDADGNGVVTKEDLLQKAKEVHYYLSEEELESTIQSMDENDDGKISLEEFIAATVKIKESS